MDGRKQIEQRQWERKILRTGGTLAIGEVLISFLTIDISLGGLCLRIGNELSTGRECRITFGLELESGPERIEAKARVVYCLKAGDGAYKSGLQFLVLSAHQADLIDSYIKQASDTDMENG